MQSICHTEESLERCIRQSVLIAVRNVRFHSSLILVDQSTAGNVGRREETHVVEEDININAL